MRVRGASWAALSSAGAAGLPVSPLLQPDLPEHANTEQALVRLGAKPQGATDGTAHREPQRIHARPRGVGAGWAPDLLTNRRRLCLHRANRGAASSFSLESGLDCLHLPGEPGDLRLLRSDLFFLLTDQRLLFLRGLNQQCGEPSVVNALGILAVLLPGNNFRNNGADFLGNHTHFVLAIRPEVIGDAAELCDGCHCAVKGANVLLPPSRAVSGPAIADCRASALNDGKDSKRSLGADAHVGTASGSQCDVSVGCNVERCTHSSTIRCELHNLETLVWFVLTDLKCVIAGVVDRPSRNISVKSDKRSRSIEV